MSIGLVELFRDAHGVMTSAQLRGIGVSRHQLRLLHDAGELIRLRRGWHRHRLVDPVPKVAAAIRAGGVLTGASALALHGAWDLEGPTEVRAARADRVRPDAGMRVVTLNREAAVRCSGAVDSIGTAFLVAASTLCADDLIVVGDSLVHRELLDPDRMLELTAGLGAERRRAVARIDGACESGTETRVRLWLERHRIGVVPQALIEGVGRVDFLVGRRLVIEVDSRAHHTGEANHQSDRTRDQRLIALGYVVIRVTYADVAFGWDAVAERILRVVRRGEHRLEPTEARRAA